MLFPVVVAGLVVLVLWALFFKEENPLDKLPGPPKLPLIGNAGMFSSITPQQAFPIMREFAKKYGDRYLIKIFGRRILHIFSPSDVEVVLSHSKNITKNKPYTFLQPWLGTGLLLSTGSKWHRRRKILTPTFHFNILKNFATVIEEKSRDMVNKLKQHQEQEVNLFPAVSDFTLYTICETAMGTQLDQDKSSAAREYKAAILDIGNLLLSRIFRVQLHIDFFFKHSEVGRNFQKTITKVQSFADNVIEERKKQRSVSAINKEDGSPVDSEEFGVKKRMAMLDLLLEAESKGEIDVEGIREEVNTFMFEGHDTTAAAISFALMLIADYEESQDRIYEECQKIFGDSDRKANMSDLAEMKYLEAVIKETLRLYPSVPLISREITEDFMLDGLPMKKGTEVVIHIYDLHRRADHFSDPEVFNPDRFLNGELKHPYAYVPFSAGPRNCIGQRFAMQEMKCILCEIVRNFKLKPRTIRWRPELESSMILRPTQNIYVKFIRR